jgi:hypothetical protein
MIGSEIHRENEGPSGEVVMTDVRVSWVVTAVATNVAPRMATQLWKEGKCIVRFRLLYQLQTLMGLFYTWRRAA